MTMPLWLPNRSRWVYSSRDWSNEIPAERWLPHRSTVGGSRTAASGVPAGYVVRVDDMLDVPLRFFERERANLYDLLAWAEIGELVTWYPDANNSSFSYPVYIEAPKAGQEFRPAIDATYGRVFKAPLVLRFAATPPSVLDYYAYGNY